jgi:hypothetical protein
MAHGGFRQQTISPQAPLRENVMIVTNIAFSRRLYSLSLSYFSLPARRRLERFHRRVARPSGEGPSLNQRNGRASMWRPTHQVFSLGHMEIQEHVFFDPAYCLADFLPPAQNAYSSLPENVQQESRWGAPM